MTDPDKGDNLGYLRRTTKELERALLEMEGELDPILTSLELGEDPRAEWGTGLAQRTRQASECKHRAWLKIADIVQRLSLMADKLETAQGVTLDSISRKPGMRQVPDDSHSGKYVNVVVRGALAGE